MLVLSSQHQLLGDQFHGNAARVSGGAVAIVGASRFQVTSTQFEANTAMLGGALFLAATAETPEHFSGITASNNSVVDGDGAFMFMERPNPTIGCDDCVLSDLHQGTAFSSPPESAVIRKRVLYAAPGVPMVEGREGSVSLQLQSPFGPIRGSYYGDGVKCSLPKQIKMGSELVDTFGQISQFSYRGGITFSSYGLLRTTVDTILNISVNCAWENQVSDGTSTHNSTLTVAVYVESCLSGFRALYDPTGQVIETCLKCPAGKYAVARGAKECYICDQGLDCPGGNVVTVQSGYWESPALAGARMAFLRTVNDLGVTAPRRIGSAADKAVVLQCPVPQACPAQIDGNFKCADSYTGPLCAVCDGGYYMVDNQCTACGGVGTTALIFTSVCGVGVLAALILFLVKKWRGRETEMDDDALQDTESLIVTEVSGPTGV
eukprot:TRINITY_DN12378_c0_g1_i3.p1 TRINITY_DN12378_c0_g1~~TRINITY_DN12378_c0_g1_i3.p1  ORF type:complete len:434 (+),score=88.16 TRINITY_DN12378_c0_g1_i3:200-1501(+)